MAEYKYNIKELKSGGLMNILALEDIHINLR